MTDKNQANSQDENPSSPQETGDNAFHDLRAIADEAMRLFNDNASQSTEEDGETTHDLAKEAIKARALHEQQQREATQDAQSISRERSLFTDNMRVQLESNESHDVILKEVNQELIVGRADNVTDYIPEIDLTPHGAYRLGLSRRHAVILRENNRVVVRDLNSRNGTFVNGDIVPGGGTLVLCDGDEIRFGNLVMTVTFVSN